MRASLALSYQGLGDVDQRAFRLLGLLDVPDFAPWMLSALLDVPSAEAEDIAERLGDAQLLDTLGEDTAGQIRYRLHDLLRLFAKERLAAEDTPATRRAALERTLQTYFERAHDAVRQLRLRPPELPGQTAPAIPHDVVGRLATSYQWLAAEHTGLAVSLDQTWREGLGQLGQALARLLADFFEVYACWDEWDRTHEVALRAARMAGDRRAEASLLCGLGDLRRFQDRLRDAVACFNDSHAIFAGLHDTAGEIDSLIGLARPSRRQGRLAAAATSFEKVLELCDELTDPDRRAKAMLFFAKVRRQQGRPADALALLAGCRDIFGSVGSAGYAAYSDLVIGLICNDLGEHDQAAHHFRQALAFANALGAPRWQAYVLLNLAVTAQACRLHNQAGRHLDRALAMFQQAGDQQGATRVRRLIARFAENRRATSQVPPAK